MIFRRLLRSVRGAKSSPGRDLRWPGPGEDRCSVLGPWARASRVPGAERSASLALRALSPARRFGRALRARSRWSQSAWPIAGGLRWHCWAPSSWWAFPAKVPTSPRAR